MSGRPISRSPTMSPSPHTCKHCCKIILTLPLNTARNFRTHLPHTPREALQASRDGCPVYKYILKGYLSATSPSSINKLLQFVQGIDTDFDFRIHGDCYSSSLNEEQKRMVFFAECLSTRPFFLYVEREVEDIAWFECAMWAGRDDFKITAVPGDPCYPMFPVRPLNRVLNSRETFGLARNWLNECVHSGTDLHRLCSDVRHTSFTPKRLLEIIANDDALSIRLRIVSPDEALPYACLSYCWGGDQPVKTTKDTITQRLEGIDLQSLPQSLQDAITVTHALNLTYVWIDCLCIIQGDEADLADQLPLMPQIYKCAYITISASSASTCYDGFLQPRSTFIGCEDFTLTCSHSKNVTGNVTLFGHDKLHKDPIDTRAWTLQERLVSPRVLDFSTYHMKWKCNSRIYHDGGLHSKIRDEDTDTTCLLGTCYPRTSHPTSNSTPNQYVEDENLIHLIFLVWTAAKSQYTSRTLTFPSDKLVAIAAVAREISTSINHTHTLAQSTSDRKIQYLAGLWSGTYLPDQILWRIYGKPLPRPMEGKYRAPSWSWAAVDGQPAFDFRPDLSRVGIEVLDAGTEKVVEVWEFGPVKGGWLRVRGRVVEGVWGVNGGWLERVTRREKWGEVEDESDEDDLLIDCQNLHADAIEPDWDVDDVDFAIDVLCLMVRKPTEKWGPAGILLVLCKGADEIGAEVTFRRVGYFDLNISENGLFEDAPEVTITIV